MHPALSVIFFTTLSGAGYGLLAWSGIWPLLTGAGNPHPELRTLLGWCVVIGLVLVSVGFLSSLAHLGKPGRTWRALSQWRSSWMSREGVLALLSYGPALLFWLLLRYDTTPTWRLAGVGLLLTACALATVWATGMIYASLRTIPAWAMHSVPVIYLLFALGTGLAPLLTLVSAKLGLLETRSAWVPMIQGALLAASKILYWRTIDQQPLPHDRAAAIGLPGRTAMVFERPHSEANFITREMAFVLARRHARALRLLAIGLLMGGPLLVGWLIWFGLLPLAAGLGLASISLLTGTFVERWLFFAQARHLVTLYY